MKIYSIVICILTIAMLSACTPPKEKKADAKATVRLTLVSQENLAPGKSTPVTIKLNNIDARTVISNDDLETVHTQKLHLLVIDPTLTDYHHLHPQTTTTPGLYKITFTPKLTSGYRAWADITPKATHTQEFAIDDIGTVRKVAIDKSETRTATIDGYHFTLSFDHPLAAGEEAMGSIHVTDSAGKPVETLEPVMGAFAHIVGFHEDLRTVIHAHPMGQEPTSASQRGGPNLLFHLEATKAGFTKLFVQVKINDKEIFAPFGVMIGKGS